MYRAIGLFLRLSVFAGIVAVLFWGAFSPVNAFTDWLKKGKDLLNQSTQTDSSTSIADLTDNEIGLGLKDALKVGSERVVDQLGAHDGFNVDPKIHIPLPEQFQTVRKALEPFGMSGILDDLELKLNRAAEKATPPAKQLFWDAIQEMTLDDVQGIYSGPEDAATQFFKGKMTTPLSEAMEPLVDQTLAEVGAITLYDNVMKDYRAIPFVPDVKADLNSYVVEKGLDGIFYYLAVEEAAIRKNPVKRTTEILQKVFGQ